MKKLKRPNIDSNFYLDPYATNPLLKFNLNDKRKQQKCDLLRDLALKQKMQEYRKPRLKDPPQDFPLKSQKYYKNELRNFVKQAPIPKMSKRIENRILQSTSLALRKKYPEIIKTYMISVHQEFDRIMKNYGIEKIIKPDNDDLQSSSNASKYKESKGKTEHYETFLRNRERIKRNLLIFQPFIRFILASASKELPEYFVNLSSLVDETNSTTISVLKAKLLQEIQTSTLIIQRNWYPRVGQIIIKHYKKRTIPVKQWEKALNCAGGLINRQLNEIKRRTIANLVKNIGDKKVFPTIEIIGDQNINFSPSLEDIQGDFMEIVEEILGIGRYISPLFYLFDGNAQKVIGNPRWKIEIGDVYPVEAREMVKNSLEQRFSAVTCYISSLQHDFYDLYSPEAAEKVNLFLQIPRQFEECQAKINKLREFLMRAHDILKKEFFDVAIVHQTEIHEKLSAIARELMSPFTSKLFESHTQENLSICLEFETIRTTALTHPKSTEDLVANGEYVLHIKNTYIHELEERVRKSIEMMTTLVELRELTPSELSLQIKVIAWLEKLKGVMEENATNYEYFKAVFEEKLVAVKNCLNTDIDESLPMLTVLNDMNCDEKLRDNVAILSGLLGKVKLMEDTRDWINKEEVLFKFPPSKYPKLDDIKDFVENFTTLIR